MKPDFKLFISNTCEAMPSKIWGKMILSQTSMAIPFLQQSKDNYRLVWILSHSFLQSCKWKRSRPKVSPNQKNNERRMTIQPAVQTPVQMREPQRKTTRGTELVWTGERERWMLCGIVALKANQTQHSLHWLFPFTLQAYLPSLATQFGALRHQWLIPASTWAPHLLSGFPLWWRTSIRGIGRMEDKGKGESHF